MLRKSVALVFASLCILSLAPAGAADDDVDVELIGKVLHGKRKPAVVLKVQRAIASVVLKLRSDAGEELEVRRGRIRKGQVESLTFDAPIGVTHYEGSLTIEFKDGGTGEMPLRFRVDVVAGLEIEAPPERLDLVNSRVQLRMSRSAGKCEVQVFVHGGRPQRSDTVFSGEAPWSWLTVSWKKPRGRVTKIRLLCFDEDGFSRGLELIPTAVPKLMIRQESLDVEAGKLELKMSSPVERCDLELNYEGVEAQRSSATFNGAAAGAWLPIAWKNPGSDAVLLRIVLTCVDPRSASATLEIFPWQLDVPHEEVSFETARWEVSIIEEPKLAHALDAIQTAIRRYGKIIDVKLYVIGYTDTVGDRASNQALSLYRASAIATHFRQHGVTVPILYTGFGEDSLAVPTADQTDEVRNRRARYILAVEKPEKATWKVSR